MLVNNNQELLVDWLCDRIGYVPTPYMRAIGSVGPDGNLNGVVGFDGFNGASVQMHVAGEPGWLDRAILRAAFHYPFVILDCAVVLGIVPSGNTAALRFNQDLGFTTVAIIPDAHPDGALILMQMRREECKWLKMRADMRGMH